MKMVCRSPLSGNSMVSKTLISRALVDWPGYPMSVYRNYWEALDTIGLHTTLDEMLEWVFFAFRRVNNDEHQLQSVALRIYSIVHDRLPRNHEAGYVVELIHEVLSMLYADFIHVYRLLKRDHLRIYVSRVSINGVLLEIHRSELP